MQFLDIPGNCPCCGAPTSIKTEPVSGVQTLWCTNPNCSAKGSNLLKHFVKRDCMNIDGISESKLSTLVANGIVTDFASIYHIKDKYAQVVSIEGFGQQSFTKMEAAIEKSRNVELHDLIFALGIPNVGLATARVICDYFNNDVGHTVTAKYSDLISIDGIGDVIADSFVNYFIDPVNMEAFKRLIAELHIIKPAAKINASMAGVTICVTGAVNIFKSRREVEELILKLGGKLAKSVSKSTSYLVTNDTTSGSNKNKAAAQYGIPVLSEQEFISKFGLQQYMK